MEDGKEEGEKEKKIKPEKIDAEGDIEEKIGDISIENTFITDSHSIEKALNNKGLAVIQETGKKIPLRTRITLNKEDKFLILSLILNNRRL